MDCHDEETKKGRFSLERINPDLPGGDDLEAWRLIEEQLAFHDMPPKKKQQPDEQDRRKVAQWIRTELRKGQLPGVATAEKLLLPEFGNYVDHQVLFGKRLDRVYPAPPRIWRLRPAIYNATMPRLGEGIQGLANGLNQLDGSEIKDYAAAYFIDEAGTVPLLGNAKKVAAALVGPKSRDRSCRALVAEEKPPSPETVEDAIQTVFRKALGRSPTSEELERFTAFHTTASRTGGHKPAGTALIS
ncbi:MAG: hypothetical protein AAF492_02600, partial [Verrucomicrobiota bacterium]